MSWINNHRVLASAFWRRLGKPRPSSSPIQYTAPVWYGRTLGRIHCQVCACVDLRSCSVDSVDLSWSQRRNGQQLFPFCREALWRGKLCGLKTLQKVIHESAWPFLQGALSGRRSGYSSVSWNRLSRAHWTSLSLSISRATKSWSSWDELGQTQGGRRWSRCW